jgi:hypothetical protein
VPQIARQTGKWVLVKLSVYILCLPISPSKKAHYEALEQTRRLHPLGGSGDKYIIGPTFCHASIQYQGINPPRGAYMYFVLKLILNLLLNLVKKTLVSYKRPWPSSPWSSWWPPRRRFSRPRLSQGLPYPFWTWWSLQNSHRGNTLRAGLYTPIILQQLPLLSSSIQKCCKGMSLPMDAPQLHLPTPALPGNHDSPTDHPAKLHIHPHHTKNEGLVALAHTGSN